MPVFARAIIAVIVAGVVMSLSLLSYVNIRSAEHNLQNEQETHNRVKATIENFHRRFRRLDVCIGSQRVSGKQEVEETVLIWQEYGFVDDSNLPVPRKMGATVISGDQVTIDAFSLQFLDNFSLPAELRQHNDLFAGHTLSFFHRIYGADPTPSDTLITAESDNPPPCMVLGQKPSELNRRLWQGIWSLLRVPGAAEKHGLVETPYELAKFRVDLGFVYHVWAEDRATQRVIPEENATLVGTMIDAYNTQKNKAQAPPEDQ